MTWFVAVEQRGLKRLTELETFEDSGVPKETLSEFSRTGDSSSDRRGKKESGDCWRRLKVTALSSCHLTIPLRVQLARRWLDLKQLAGSAKSQPIGGTNNAKNTQARKAYVRNFPFPH